MIICARFASEGCPPTHCPPAPPTGSCTEIGCTSGLFLRVEPIFMAFPRARTAKVCLARKCRTFRLKRTFALRMRIKRAASRKKVAVRLVIRGRHGRLLRRSKVRARVVRVRPNGAKCPPTCFVVDVRIRPRDGRIVKSR